MATSLSARLRAALPALPAPLAALAASPAARPLAWTLAAAAVHAAWVGSIEGLGHVGSTQKLSPANVGVVSVALAATAAVPFALGAALSACGACLGASASPALQRLHLLLLAFMAAGCLTGCCAASALMVQPQYAFQRVTPVDPLWQFLGALFALVELFGALGSLWALGSAWVGARAGAPPASALVSAGFGGSGEALAKGFESDAAGAGAITWRAAFAPAAAESGVTTVVAAANAAPSSLAATAVLALGAVRLGAGWAQRYTAVLLAIGFGFVVPMLLSIVLPAAWVVATRSWYSTATRVVPSYYTVLPAGNSISLAGFGSYAGNLTFIYTHFYIDVAVYFGAIGAVMLAGSLGLLVPRVRRMLAMRMRVPSLRELMPALHKPAFLASLPAMPALSTLVPARFAALVPESFLAAPPSGPFFDHGAISVGELIVACALCALLCWWAWYWGCDYARIQTDVVFGGTHGADKFPLLHVWAKALGHMATLSFALAMLPVARNGLWDAVFGIPFERALRWHHHLGALSWLATTLHMALWVAKWQLEGTNVATNLMATGTPNPLQIALSTTGYNKTIVSDFTIPLALFAWVVMSLSIAVAVCRRRVSFELFHASHSVLYFVLFVVEIHSWSSWYFTLGSLALYALDKATRAGRGSVGRNAIAVPAGDVTALHVLLPGNALSSAFAPLGGGGFAAAPRAGCYAFVCVPAVAPHEWHPITLTSVSSADADGALDAGAEAGALVLTAGTRVGGGTSRPGSALRASFCIRSTGGSSWSSRLLLLAEARLKASHGRRVPIVNPMLPEAAVSSSSAVLGGLDADGQGLSHGVIGRGRIAGPAVDAETEAALLAPLIVQLDGPYGALPLPSGVTRLFLIAGGIGVTPMHALLTALLQTATANGERRKADPSAAVAALPRVTLVWSVSEPELLGLFASTLAAAADAAEAGLLQLDLLLHVTRAFPDLVSPQSSMHLLLLSQSLAATAPPMGRRGSDEGGHQVVKGCRPSEAAVWPAVIAGLCTAEAAKRVAALARLGRPDLVEILAPPAEAAVGATAENAPPARDVEDAAGAGAGLGASATGIFAGMASLGATGKAMIAPRPAALAAATAAASSTCVLACGPEALTSLSSDLAIKAGFEFHSETFFF